MIEFEILARGLYRPDQVAITYDPSLRMPTTPAIQQWMDTLWQQKLANAQQERYPLYDSQLFRLVYVETWHEGQEEDRLHLVLGNASYKEYTTTLVPEFAQGRSRQELSNVLAVCSVIETSDGYILYERRRNVAVYVGRYHVIGGFFERDRDATMATTTSATNPDPFVAIRREIREETGIQAGDITEQYCLGVAYDLTTPHAEACFLTQLCIPLNEVHQRVSEDNEIQQLLSLYVTQESLRDFILTNHGNISATGEPNLLLYGAVKFGEGWFEEVMARLVAST